MVADKRQYHVDNPYEALRCQSLMQLRNRLSDGEISAFDLTAKPIFRFISTSMGLYSTSKRDTAYFAISFGMMATKPFCSTMRMTVKSELEV